MKKLILIAFAIIAIALFWQGCRKPEKTGTIYGTVTDQATGEPVKIAGVELFPIGLKTVTGSDGTYQFTNVEYGEYELFVTKIGYESTKKSGIQLKGTSVQYDVQMAKLPAALRIMDDNGNDIDHLDFGYEVDDVSRLFNIFNDGESPLEWHITTTANWITVSETNGVLQAGNTKGIIVVINRNNLHQGENTTTLHVTSDNGNKQLIIKAMGGLVYTEEATSITANTAILHGKIIRDIPYSEKGFVYGANHNLNNTVTVDGNGVGDYSAHITSLSSGTMYYFKAYCVSNGTYFYGEEKQFQHIPSFEYEGHTYWVAPDPGYNISYNDAVLYCEGLSLHGSHDWQMPNKAQMLIMYANKESIGGWPTGNYYYWTSDYTSDNYGRPHYYLIGIEQGNVISTDYLSQSSNTGRYYRIRPICRVN